MGIENVRRVVVRRKLRIILFTRRTWWEYTGDREAARKVTQELFDLAFRPDEQLG